ncbi:MAG: hypothetical protein QG654_493 [Patescibacteria group bacterium]|jgi:hypothetical protein|nr:hypothetical protein [Patescibacteria group bacterium]
MAQTIGEINGQKTLVTVVKVPNTDSYQPPEYLETAIAYAINNVRQNPDNHREGEVVIITGYDFVPNKNGEIILAVKWHIE